jgi:tetrahydromethanopterin S-methyltransferase subunit G
VEEEERALANREALPPAYVLPDEIQRLREQIQELAETIERIRANFNVLFPDQRV